MTYRTNSSNFYFFMENKFGSIELLSNNKIYAGKFTTIKLVYTAGYYVIFDSGSIIIYINLLKNWYKFIMRNKNIIYG